MHANTESDVPSHHAYYVQSPCGVSHEDVDKLISSPVESPSHPSSLSRHSSRSSSYGSLSGRWRWTVGGSRRSTGSGWGECNVVDEEGDYDDDDDDDDGGDMFSLRYKCFLGFMVLGTMFGMFCLVIWGASRLYKPQIIIKSLKVHNFYYGEGADHTGVPTKLLTINSSVSMVIYNPATFFGIHVNSNNVNLIYSQLPVATGQINSYYQPRKSNRLIIVDLSGRRVPLYGGGESLGVGGNGDVPMKLDLELHSRGNLVGKLVKTYHRIHISCSLLVNSKTLKDVNFVRDSCGLTVL